MWKPLSTIRMTVLLHLGLLMLPVAAQALPDVVAIPLFKVNTTASVDDYLMKIRLGQPAQDVSLIPSFYVPTLLEGRDVGASIFVLTPDSCLGLENGNTGNNKGNSTASSKENSRKNYKRTSTEWNAVIDPSEDEIVNVHNHNSNEKYDGVYHVRWTTIKDTAESVNLSLRKGKGQRLRNITIIAMNIQNNGEYSWNASKTFYEGRLQYDDDYSIMLWTDSSGRRLYSNLFGFGSILKNGFAISKRSSPSLNLRSASCLSNLTSHGGFYNQSLDKTFQLGENSIGSVEDPTSVWRAQLSGTGYTSVSWPATDPSTREVLNVSLSNVGIGLMDNVTQGKGILSLMDLQSRRMGASSESNVVGLYLGNGKLAGNIVMGGYNKALIDNDHGAAAFLKMGTEFRVELSHITVVSGSDLYTRGFRLPGITQRESDQGRPVIVANIPSLRLSYDSPNILLPLDIVDDLLPYLGSPAYQKDLGGYVYENTFEPDFSLVFTIRNGTETVNITVPSTSLIVEESSSINNSGSSVTGRKCLLLAPIQQSDELQIGYLGRTFLKNVYLVNDDFLGKFYLSAVNTTAAAAEIEDMRSRSDGILNSGVDNRPSYLAKNKNNIAVGAIIGGIVGGVGVFWIIVLICYSRKKYKQSISVESKNKGGGSDQLPTKEPSKIAVTPAPGFPKEFDTVTTPVENTDSKESTSEGITCTFTIGTSPNSSGWKSSMQSQNEKELPPTPPMKDVQYLKVKRFSQPMMRESSLLAATTRNRQSTPLFALGASSQPYDHSSGFYQVPAKNEEDGLSSPMLACHGPRQHDEEENRAIVDGWTGASSSAERLHQTETATMGRVISKGQVLSITPPNPLLPDISERRASVGRVVSPTEIMVASRHSSRGSQELLRRTKCQSIGGMSDTSDQIGGSRNGSLSDTLERKGEENCVTCATGDGGISQRRNNSYDSFSASHRLGHSRHSSMPPLSPTSPQRQGNDKGTKPLCNKECKQNE